MTLRPHQLTLLAVLAFTLLACGGGQRLSMIINSTPPDALVYVNDFPRGVTPVEVPYIYRGTYRVQLMREGYEPVDALVSPGKPWYNWIPFASLFLDSLPTPIHHRTRYHYVLDQDSNQSTISGN